MIAADILKGILPFHQGVNIPRYANLEEIKKSITIRISIPISTIKQHNSREYLEVNREEMKKLYPNKTILIVEQGVVKKWDGIISPLIINQYVKSHHLN